MNIVYGWYRADSTGDSTSGDSTLDRPWLDRPYSDSTGFHLPSWVNLRRASDLADIESRASSQVGDSTERLDDSTILTAPQVPGRPSRKGRVESPPVERRVTGGDSTFKCRASFKTRHFRRASDPSALPAAPNAVVAGRGPVRLDRRQHPANGARSRGRGLGRVGRVGGAADNRGAASGSRCRSSRSSSLAGKYRKHMRALRALADDLDRPRARTVVRLSGAPDVRRAVQTARWSTWRQACATRGRPL